MASTKVNQVTALGDTFARISSAEARNEIGRLMLRPNQPSPGFIEAWRICQVTAEGRAWAMKWTPSARGSARGSSRSSCSPARVTSMSAGRTIRRSPAASAISSIRSTRDTCGNARSRTAKLCSQSEGTGPPPTIWTDLAPTRSAMIRLRATPVSPAMRCSRNDEAGIATEKSGMKFGIDRLMITLGRDGRRRPLSVPVYSPAARRCPHRPAASPGPSHQAQGNRI